MPGEETAADDADEADDAEVMKVESTASLLRAALMNAGADEIGEEDEAEAQKDDEAEEAAVVAAARKRARAKAVRAMPELEGDITELEPNEVGQEELVEVPVSKESARFAKTLRNLAARQKAGSK